MEIKILQGEYWWTGCVNNAHNAPYTIDSVGEFSMFGDIETDQYAPVLVSSKGRYFWSDKPFTAKVKDGVISLNLLDQGELEEGYVNLRGAYLAVIESVSKLIAAGADFSEVYLTFQEYFEKPLRDPKRWGKPLAALLGAGRYVAGAGAHGLVEHEAKSILGRHPVEGQITHAVGVGLDAGSDVALLDHAQDGDLLVRMYHAEDRHDDVLRRHAVL